MAASPCPNIPLLAARYGIFFPLTRPNVKLKLAAAVCVIVIIAILCRLDPVEYPLFPRCLFRQLTGLSCPGCGMQRFVHALANGHFAEAAAYNYFLLLLLPYVGLFILERCFLTGRARDRLRSLVEGRLVTTALAASIPIWFVVRNVLGV